MTSPSDPNKIKRIHRRYTEAFKSIQRKKNKYSVQYSRIPIYEPITHECDKSECHYCRIMNDIDNGRLVQIWRNWY